MDDATRTLWLVTFIFAAINTVFAFYRDIVRDRKWWSGEAAGWFVAAGAYKGLLGLPLSAY